MAIDRSAAAHRSFTDTILKVVWSVLKGEGGDEKGENERKVKKRVLTSSNQKN